MMAIRGLLLAQIAIFGSAALIHFGVLFDGYLDQAAGTAETVIAIVLLAGLLLTWSRSPWGRRGPIGAHAFALIGTLVGLSLTVLIGPRTALDIGYHLAMVAALMVGRVASVRGASAFVESSRSLEAR